VPALVGDAPGRSRPRVLLCEKYLRKSSLIRCNGDPVHGNDSVMVGEAFWASYFSSTVFVYFVIWRSIT
jgi:hypothetical protein